MEIDDTILKLLKITRWEEANEFFENKAKKEAEFMNQINEYIAGNTPEEIMQQPNEFTHFDEYPEDSPFLDSETQAPEANIYFPADIAEEQFKAEATSDLIESLREFLSFSTPVQLMALVNQILHEESGS